MINIRFTKWFSKQPLLRVLQEKEIERIGGKGSIKLDVRIVAATNRNLEKEIEEGRFREDLYYRLNIFPVELPPLRDRADDIPILVNYFINKYSKQAGKKIRGVSNSVMAEILRYSWPGNIRELEHFIERNVLLAKTETINEATLQLPEKKRSPASPASLPVLRSMDDHEREIILQTIKYCNGRISGPDGAAYILGIPPTTLHSKMKKLGIVKSHTNYKKK